MSRSGYDYDGDEDTWALIRYAGALQSSIRGARGQRLLRELLAALDAMPEKTLIADELQNADGDHCALGVVAVARGIDVAGIDPYATEQVAAVFDIAPALARHVAYVNDEGGNYWSEHETPEARWRRVRAWVAGQVLSGATEP